MHTNAVLIEMRWLLTWYHCMLKTHEFRAKDFLVCSARSLARLEMQILYWGKVSGWDVVAVFENICVKKFGYNIFMTSVSTVIGYVAAWIFSGFSNSMTKMFQEVVPTNPLIVILGIIVLYVIGIFIGLIPTKDLIKKTPSEINSKYDI